MEHDSSQNEKPKKGSVFAIREANKNGVSSMQRKNNVLITLGMHRSGTSLTAQWLHACGLHLGDQLIGSSVGNENGHFEDSDFHDLHEEIFRANRISYGGLKGISQLNVSDHQRARIKRLIDRNNGLHTTWGFKDPRTCLFANMYENLIDCPTYLIVYRGANEVVDSLLRRLENMLLEGYYRRRIIDRLKFFMIRRGISILSTRKIAREYTESWILYNQRILDFIKTIDKDRYKVIHHKNILQGSGHLFSWLNVRNFELEEIPFEDILDHTMISSKVSGNRIDKDLKGRVGDIEDQFQKLEIKYCPPINS
jgi:hypothetical protein